MILSNFFEYLLKYDFLQYALIAGIIIGVLAPLIGSIVVVKRLSFIADTLSHFSLAGVCFGVLLSKTINFTLISPLLMGILFSILGTFIIEKLRTQYKNYKELSMPIVMSFGVSLSGIFISLSKGMSAEETNQLLFGNLYTVTLNDLIVILSLGTIIITLLIIFRHQFILVCFDEEFARINGLNVKGFQFIITMILAVSISLFMDIVGVLLISALMIVPIAASIPVGNSFKHTVAIAIIISEVSIIFGFIISFYLSLPTGSTMVLISIIILLGILCYNNIKKFIKKKKMI